MSGFGQQDDTPVTPAAPTTPAPAAPAAPTLPEGSVVIGDKVYKLDDLAKKLENQESHIATLETENATHIEQGTKILERLAALETSKSDGDDISKLIETLKAPATPEPEQTVTISKEELVEAAVNGIKAEQVEVQQKENLSAAVAKAQAAYGEDDYGTKIDEMGKALGMDVTAVTTLAKNNPDAWAKLFLPVDQQRAPDTTQSTQNGVVVPPVEKPKSYFKMRTSKEQRTEFQRRMAEGMAKYGTQP